ncbi:TraC family protein, partial [Tistrella bauzanensis]
SGAGRRLKGGSHCDRDTFRRPILQQALEGLQMQPTVLTPSRYLHLMNGILHQGEHAHWRQSSTFDWDETRPISEQIFDHDAPVVVHSDHLEIGDHQIATVSVKQFPKLIAFGGMINLIGNLTTGTSAIRGPFVLTANIYLPSSHAARQVIGRKNTLLTNQVYGPLTKWVPGLFAQKEGFDELTRALDDGGRPLQLALSLVLIAKDRDARIEAVSQAVQLWQGNRVIAMPDKYIVLPIAFGALPFGAELGLVQQLHRYRTMATQHAVRLLPLFAEWRGTSTPLMTFASRTGQLMPVSPFDSNTNYNVVVAAESGGGKSFMTNEMIAGARASGAIVRVIDIGRSYEKLAESLGGTNLVFGPTASLDLNPFPLISDWSEERDILMGLVEAMAAPTMPLTDHQRASLGEFLSHVWEDKGHRARIDDVADVLQASDDVRIKDIGIQLYPFTSKGDYGRYFDGSGRPVDFENGFITLELEELAGSDHLRKVVLLVLIYRIQQEAYLGDRSVSKLLIIDEAWQLMDSPSVATFLNSAFRRFRKYNASAVVITQSLNDFYQTASGVGKAILENAATIMLLHQKSSTLEKLKSTGELPIDAGYEAVAECPLPMV